jgi:hypothetical protein
LLFDAAAFGVVFFSATAVHLLRILRPPTRGGSCPDPRAIDGAVRVPPVTGGDVTSVTCRV